MGDALFAQVTFDVAICKMQIHWDGRPAFRPGFPDLIVIGLERK